MEFNMVKTDRIARIITAVVINTLFYAGLIRGITAIIPGIIAIYLVLTGVIGYCPLIGALKSLRRRKRKKTEDIFAELDKYLKDNRPVFVK